MAKRTYTETEKLGTMMLALREGVPAAAKATDVPERTIYQWFETAGGFAEIRTFVDTSVAIALSAASQAIANEVERLVKGGKVPLTELMTTFREMLQHAASVGKGGAVAGAQAQTFIQVTTGPRDGNGN